MATLPVLEVVFLSTKVEGLKFFVGQIAGLGRPPGIDMMALKYASRLLVLYKTIGQTHIGAAQDC
jgi:hypothetical protein